MTIKELSKKNKYGDTAVSIAQEIGHNIAENESFLLFCYWAEIENEYSLEDMEDIFFKYLYDREWLKYQEDKTQ